ncbi:MAG: trigger factor [Myxococcales bacterium]|nr:trigger factor [Myxococcales bacterium]
MSPSAKKGAAAAKKETTEATTEAAEIRVETQQGSGVVRSVGVTIPQSQVRRAFDRTYHQLARTASVRGFRKGKVPRSVLEKLYGASIPEEIERSLVHDTIQDAIEKTGLTPLVQPEVEATPPQPDADFEYTLRIEVKPEIELPDLEGLPAKAPKISVDAKEVDEELERLRQRNAPLIEEAEDVQVAKGHTVSIDYEGRVDGELFDGGKAENVDLEIGSGRMIPGFEDGLIGVRAGEDVTLKVTFPEEYGAANLAGKDAEFSCTVHTIRRQQVPELDDEFAKDLGEFDTLDELRAKITGDFTKRQEQAAESAVQRSVMDSLLERTDFEVPPGVVERQLNSQIQSMQQQFQGQLPPDMLQQQLSRMREDGRSSAERRVRESLVLEAIAVAKEFQVTPEETDARFDEMAEAQGMDVKKLKQMAETQGWGEAIEAELLDQKALAFLVSKATVEELVEEEVAQEAEAG